MNSLGTNTKAILEIIVLGAVEKLLKETIDFIWPPTGYTVIMTKEFMNRWSDGKWHHCSIDLSNIDSAYVSVDGLPVEKSGLEIRRGCKSIPITQDMKSVSYLEKLDGEYWIKLDAAPLDDESPGSRIYSTGYVVSDV